MAEEYRDSVYWGAKENGRWYKESIQLQLKADTRWKGSLMRFVRHAVRFCLENDPSLKKSRSYNKVGSGK